MTSPEPPEPTPSGVDRCLVCSELLAHDQRYCVHCGTRRAPLPAPIAASLQAMSGRGSYPLEGAEPEPEPEPEAAAAGGDVGIAEPSRERSVEIFPLARAAAVSILLMLGLGAVFGASLRPGGVASL